MMPGNSISIRVAIFVLGLCGFIVARHIRDRKTKNQPLICPVKFDCNAVVTSDYSKFFGVPVEIFGMVYYAAISLAYLFLIFMPAAMPTGLLIFLILISLTAFLFSVYLLAVQIFVLKRGCSWCIASSLIAAIIFLLTTLSNDFSILAQIFIK